MKDKSRIKSIRGALVSFWRDRTAKTLIFAALLILGMGLSRPDKPIGMYPNEFWTAKIAWRHCADAVITGDSRIVTGLSPAEMQKTLAGRRILNYGFAGNWYSREYLEAVEKVLDPHSNKRTIIMGITPYSLTKRTKVKGHFLGLKQQSKQDAYLNIHFAALINFVEPMSFRDALLGLFSSLSSKRTRREYSADGWLAVNRQPRGERREVKRYKQIYEEQLVCDENIKNVLDFTSRWRKKGIRVYGFQPPTCQQMLELETRVSGFNKAEFVKAFEAAGGIWIEVDQCHYYSFDGSHLEDRAALEFSIDLAQRIYDIEQQKKKQLAVRHNKE